MAQTELFIDVLSGEQTVRELNETETLADEAAKQSRHEYWLEMQKAARRGAFQTEADPLFFAWQRGESTEQAWLDKCAEIRERYPYIEAP